MTGPQIITVQKARRRLKLSDEQYRLILTNVANVTSSKDLDNATFEDVMAVMEDMGYQMPDDRTYWRNKVANRGRYANERLAHKIKELIAQQDRYPLDALCRRFSGGRTADVSKLRPHEAYKLIEMLKEVSARAATD